MKKEQGEYFMKGFGLAVAELIRFGEFQIAKKITVDSGFKLEDFKKAKIDEFDMKELVKIYEC